MQYRSQLPLATEDRVPNLTASTQQASSHTRPTLRAFHRESSSAVEANAVGGVGPGPRKDIHRSADEEEMSEVEEHTLGSFSVLFAQRPKHLRQAVGSVEEAEEESRSDKHGKRKNETTLPPSKKSNSDTTTDSETVVCRWAGCGAQCPNLDELGNHLAEHIKHHKAANRREKRSGYFCEWEGCTRTKPFKGCYNLEHHLRYQHTGEKPFVCPKFWCNSRFAQHSDLKEHLRNIHCEDTVAVKKKPTVRKEDSKSQESNKVRKIMFPRSFPIPIAPHPILPTVQLYPSIEQMQQQQQQQQNYQLQQRILSRIQQRDGDIAGIPVHHHPLLPSLHDTQSTEDPPLTASDPSSAHAYPGDYSNLHHFHYPETNSPQNHHHLLAYAQQPEHSIISSLSQASSDTSNNQLNTNALVPSYHFLNTRSLADESPPSLPSFFSGEQYHSTPSIHHHFNNSTQSPSLFPHHYDYQSNYHDSSFHPLSSYHQPLLPQSFQYASNEQ